MPISGVDHVLLAAPPGCEREARSFYGTLLGLEEIAARARLRRSPEARDGAKSSATPTCSSWAPAANQTPPAERISAGYDDPWGNRVELLGP